MEGILHAARAAAVLRVEEVEALALEDEGPDAILSSVSKGPTDR